MALSAAQIAHQKKQAEELLFSGPEALGFAKSLFFGRFQAAHLFPYPTLPPDERAKAIQDLVYDAGRHEPFLEPAKEGAKGDGRPGVSRAWFNALYQVLLGQPEGPRFGGFVALYGIAGTIGLIETALAREETPAA